MIDPQRKSREEEIDDIYSLLAYSLVYQDWQPDSIPRDRRRGYNIGALIVDLSNSPVYAALNCINSSNDATQHGELRAITKYINSTKCFNLAGFTIYTTLEPCIMCAGMMTMTAVKRNVYGQHDVAYSKAFQRLSIDTRKIGGFEPYPRQVLAQASPSDICIQLDKAYEMFLKKDPEKILAKFLSSGEAKYIYEEAYNRFQSYNISYNDNALIYQQALNFLNSFQNE